jgi:hypothetical protein
MIVQPYGYVEIPTEVVFDRYADNNRVAMILIDPETGEQYTRVTVNMPEVMLKQDHVLIKDYSENKGVLDALVRDGIVHKPYTTYPTGYVEVHACELTNEAKKELK